MANIWIAELRISDKTATKILTLHGLQADDVRDAVLCVSGLAFTWHTHPKRGRRAIIRTEIRGVDCLVVLYPAIHPFGDVWNLGSAYPIH